MYCAAEDNVVHVITAEVIVLGSTPRIRVKRGPFLIGYFGSVEAMIAAGVNMANVTIKE